MTRRFPALLALAFLAACRLHPDPPLYMQDAAADDAAARKALAALVAELGDGFVADRVEDIYFVASDAGPAELERCKGTIQRMDGFLRRAYFERRPSEPLRVLLFKDEVSYGRHVRKAYGRDPETPFGFYVSSDRTMVMNISTGTGTLAHELVHPLLAEDFPSVPSWFNEGFASLFEQSSTDRKGNVVGLVNWRLQGLKKALREERDATISRVIATDLPTFYGDDSGLNYAVARYLCLWLQEEGLLERYYKEFKSTSRTDPSGRAALEKIVGKKVEELQPLWEKWVSSL